MKMRSGLSILVLLVLGDTAGSQTFVRLGGEFQINTYTTGSQRLPEVSSTPEGEFVVVWSDVGDSYPFFDGRDGRHSGVFGQRFSALGSPLGGDFQVNTYTTGGQSSAAVGVNAAGGFVVVWSSLFPVSRSRTH